MSNHRPLWPARAAAPVQRGGYMRTRSRNANRVVVHAIALFGFFALSSSAWPVHAQSGSSPAIDFSNINGGSDYYQGTYSIGWNFTAHQNLEVTHLGYYDDRMNGLASSHLVGIYDMTTQALLGSATVSPGDPLSGYFRYVQLATPITLQAGKDYAIEGESGLDNYLIGVSSITVDPAIAFIGYAGDSGFALRPSGIAFPGTFAVGVHGDFGPNFRFTGDASGCGPTPVSVAMFPLTASASQGILFSAQASITAPFAGAMSFQIDGAGTACTANMDGVNASCTHPLSVGVYSVVARYSGDGQDPSGCSAASTVTVVPDTTQAATNCNLIATPNPAQQGRPVTMTISCQPSARDSLPAATPSSPTLTGYATFSYGPGVIAYVPLTNNAATYTTVMSGGTFPITATYSGDSANATSSSTVSVVVDTPADNLFYDGFEIVHL